MSALAHRRTAALGTLLLVLSVLPMVAMPASADGGDFSIDFTASEPFSYHHDSGGGAFDDRTIGVDVVESLEGGDFACGDTVTYLTQIVVDSGAAGAQTIELDYEFSANTTGQPGAGHVDISLVQVNRSPIVDLHEPDTNEDGISDDGGSVATLSNEQINGTLFQGSATVTGTATITDLEAGEHVIVRVDTIVDCDDDLSTSPTGNLQARIVAGRVIAGGSGTINLGQQTIPFKKLAELAHPGIGVVKTADPESRGEPGGDFTYTVVVTNTGDVSLTLNSLIDDQYGNLNGKGTCFVPQTIAVGGFYSCTFTESFFGNAGDQKTNVVIATGVDRDGTQVLDSDDATVSITDVLPEISVTKSADPDSIPEPGGSVTFTVTVTNGSAEAVTITSLTDTVFGDLSGDDDCRVGTVLAADGGSCSFQFTETVAGNAGEIHTDTVTAVAEDDENNPAEDTDDAHVTITNAGSSITVTKTPDPGTVPEPGASVTFTVEVANTSDVDTVWITSLTDTVFGVLDGQGTCSIPEGGIELDPGDVFTCEFQGEVTGQPGETHANRATAEGHDDDEEPVENFDDAFVDVVDVPSSITIAKTPDPGSIQEPGGDVTYALQITNTSDVDTVWITSLTDDKFGDLDGKGTCSVPEGGIELDPGDVYSCAFVGAVAGTGGSSHVNTATASGIDDDKEAVQASDDATVTITTRPPPPPPPPPPSPGTIVITKDAAGDADDVFVFTGSLGRLVLGDGESHTASGLAAGTYTVTEAAVAGWQLTGLSCVDPSGGTITDLANGTATISLAGGETVSCTFTNVAVLGIQVTTTVEVAAETLPFTGGDAQDLTLMGLMVLAGGGLLLMAVSRREEEPEATPASSSFRGWSR